MANLYEEQKYGGAQAYICSHKSNRGVAAAPLLWRLCVFFGRKHQKLAVNIWCFSLRMKRHFRATILQQQLTVVLGEICCGRERYHVILKL